MTKLNPKHYATAYLDLLLAGIDEARANSGLMRVLLAHGDMARRDQVLGAVQKESIRRRGGRIVKVEFAHETGAQNRTNFLANWGKEDKVEVIINPNLVAGVKVLIDGEDELDLSLGSKLDKILAP